MNCIDCKENLGFFLDSELEESKASLVREHLAVCGECAKVCEDLSAILFTCGAEDTAELVPPNSQALWCRISNTIESELQPAALKQAEPVKGRFWKLSLPQLA